MHHFPKIYTLMKNHRSMEEKQSSKTKNNRMDLSQSPRTLVRTNAAKKFNYTPSVPSSASPPTSDSSAPRTWSLDQPSMTSFRTEGQDGDLGLIWQILELSGPEDFQIPKAAYDLMMSRSAPDVIQRPQRGILDHDELKAHTQETNKFVESVPHRFITSVQTNLQHATTPFNVNINGDLPPLLTAPLPLGLNDDSCSTWDMLERMPPHEDSCTFQSRVNPSDDAENVGKIAIREKGNGVRLGETIIMPRSCSFTTSNDDDTSSTTTEPVSIISPNNGCRINITHWEKGKRLGSGSFGTVYEGISSEGFFFAIKEVSLLEQGSQGRQSIYQLEQEIELLSQFEHENIVQYLGTEKVESKLYIFLELVTQGSLASLYQKYHLRDSHVSAYTRQILMGLKYLHDRNVVHRDIKCANILVASNGAVKLADFGLAKATRLNDLKSFKGTAFWMAPEVIYHKNQGYGLAADIWSLGCTVLEMLTRNIPYYPLEFPQALFRIAKGELPSIPDSLSADARDFIQQCLRVNANDRPTAAELLDHQFVQRPLYIPFGSDSPMMPVR